ncbi:MAG: MarR family transcriptional regulator [Proteobacteria bacterium]|nr:MarR family transcriptional regulator [Pseudomonadota bacterium]
MKPARKPARARRADAKLLADPAYARFLLDDSPFYLIARTGGRYNLDMQRIMKSVDMDVPRWRALMILRERNPSSVSEIAERTVIQLSTVTRVVQRLQRQGLVKLASRKSDARKTDVTLTPRGEQAVQQVRKCASRIYRLAFHDFSAREIEALNTLLRRVYANLDLRL